MRSSYNHIYQANGTNMVIRPGDRLRFQNGSSELYVMDVFRNTLLVRSDERIDLYPQPINIMDSRKNVIQMRVIDNDENTWYTLEYANPKMRLIRKKVRLPKKNDVDHVLETLAEDDVTMAPILDDWWTKPDWKTKLQKHPEYMTFQVILARRYAREAMKEPNDRERDRMVVLSLAAMES